MFIQDTGNVHCRLDAGLSRAAGIVGGLRGRVDTLSEPAPADLRRD
ncbi:hypothetical protein JL100_029440 [Skermanella mucosa]|nr:hypothetical protein [Skermanella mucosa]UEM21137.1 hypothetical protein JL100_029440 [Skermanella mucosa]